MSNKSRGSFWKIIGILSENLKYLKDDTKISIITIINEILRTLAYPLSHLDLFRCLLQSSITISCSK